MSSDYTLAELAIVAASEIFRDETPEVFATLIGTLPKLAGYVAKETFLPGMMMSDGIYYLAAEPVPVGPRGDYPIKKEGRIGYERWLQAKSIWLAGQAITLRVIPMGNIRAGSTIGRLLRIFA